MVSKAQRKSQKSRRKQQLKKKREQRDRKQGKPILSNAGSALRQAERVARQKPRSWTDEPAEDVALFNVRVRESLSAELAEQAVAVCEALQLVHDLRYANANARVAHIPRSSPYSEWRLFIRGLAIWSDGNNLEAAATYWDRLDRQRRPGRIATVLRASHRTDLESLKAGTTLDGDTQELDSSLIYGAKLIRRLRIDRKSIVHAEQGTSRPEESPELSLGPAKIEWLTRFSAEYRDLEPELVRSLQQAALERAYHQSYYDLFTKAVKAFTGPRHDQRNLLLSFHFYGGDKPDRADLYLKRYLTNDLPTNPNISDRLRSALQSQILLNEANSKESMNRASPFAGFGMRGIFGGGFRAKEIEEDFQAAIKAYPSNLAAHKRFVQFLQSELEERRLDKAEEKRREARLAKAMMAWSKALPEEIEPRLWLVDHFLEAEETEQAKPHVDWLRGSRHDDPRVRATPWKWSILEASRLARRKTWLKEARLRLDEAEKLWPAWLSRQWLPYLRAATILRTGHVEEFQEQRAEDLEASDIAQGSLADVCMSLGAAQLMRVPAAQLKPLRAAVDQALENSEQRSMEEFVEAGNFFWDLHRTSLLYPSYRRHGPKFAREFLDRVDRASGEVEDLLESDRFGNAVLWLAAHRFLANPYEIGHPDLVEFHALKRPKLAAAILHSELSRKYLWNLGDFADHAEVVRKATLTESDPYYRFWFGSLVSQMDEALANVRTPERIARAFGFDVRDDEDDDFDEELGFDPNCDCDDCRAARKAAGYS